MFSVLNVDGANAIKKGNNMKVKIYLNKLGHESYLTTMDYNIAPLKGDLIEVGDPNNEESLEVYKVKQRLISAPETLDEYSLFVEPYNWED